MSGYIPLMTIHRSTDVQSKKNCIKFHLSLDLLHFIHCGQIIVYRSCWQTEVYPYAMEHLVKIRMGNIMVLPMNSGSTNEPSQLLSIAIFYIDAKDDDFQIPNVEVSSEGRQSFVSVIVGVVAISIMSISDKDMQEAPVGGSCVFFKKLMKFDHEIVAVKQGISHGCASVWMNIPNLPRSGRPGGLFKTTGGQGKLAQEMLVLVRGCICRVHIPIFILLQRI